MASDKEKIEYKLIDWIALESNGRLIAFKPENGADLVVQKRGGYNEKKLSFKIETASLLKGENTSEKNYYFVFANFDEVKQNIVEKIAVISSVDLLEVIKKIEKTSVNGIALKDFLNNKEYSTYLMDKKSFVSFLIANLIADSKSVAKTGFKSKKY